MGFNNDVLMMDEEAFLQASKDMGIKCSELGQFRKDLTVSFAQLKKDWDSDAGKKFFERFENDLLNNLDKYALVFEHMSKNLSTASQKYEEVFRAADAVADAQY